MSKPIIESTLTELHVSTPQELAEKFAEVRNRLDADLRNHHSITDWEPLRVNWLSRKSGVLAKVKEHWLDSAPPELKPSVGQAFNELRAHIESSLKTWLEIVQSTVEQSAHDQVDLSLPGVIRPIGSHHLIRQVFQEIEDIFFSIGFSIVEGPEIETPYYNFEALNIPEFHPVRDDR